MFRRLLLIGFVLALAGSQSSVLAHDPQVALSAFGTATIDGVFSPGEWSGASSVPFAVKLPPEEGGGTTPAVLHVMNDSTNLYIALAMTRSSLDPVMALGLDFDRDHNAVLESGDDGFVVNVGASQTTEFVDFFRTTMPPCTPDTLCGFRDTDYGGTNDGAAAGGNDGALTVIEMVHPLDSVDDLHDFSLGRGDTVGFRLSVRVFGLMGTFADTDFPLGPFGDITVAPQVLGNGDFRGDFDGDGRVDVAVFRPSTGTWFIRQSSTLTMSTIVWGGRFDTPVPGDYDGDGKTDVAIFRPSTGEWFIRQSGTLTPSIVTWGGFLDTPVPGDYDGDGKTDVAVFRRSTGTWYIRQSSTLTMLTILWGGSLDKPVPGDYDGDRIADVAIFRPSTGTWYIRLSSTLTPSTIAWGSSFDTPVPADYDGDGKVDVAVFRLSTGEWFIRQSGTSTLETITWGISSDQRTPGDYDGDGKTDVAIFRSSTGEWFIRQSSTLTPVMVTWGGGADVPILKRP